MTTNESLVVPREVSGPPLIRNRDGFQDASKFMSQVRTDGESGQLRLSSGIDSALGMEVHREREREREGERERVSKRAREREGERERRSWVPTISRPTVFLLFLRPIRHCWAESVDFLR